MFKFETSSPAMIDYVSRPEAVDWIAKANPSSWMHVIHMDFLLICVGNHLINETQMKTVISGFIVFAMGSS